MIDNDEFQKTILSLFTKSSDSKEDECLKSRGGKIEIVKTNTPEIIESDINQDIQIYIDEYNKQNIEKSVIMHKEGFNTKIKRKLVIEKYFHEDSYIITLHKVDFSIPLSNPIFSKIKTPKKYINNILNSLERKLSLSFELLNSINLYKLVYLARNGPYNYQYKFLPEFVERIEYIFKKGIEEEVERFYLLDILLTSIDKIICMVGNYNITGIEDIELYNYRKAINFYRERQIGIFDFDTSLNYINSFELYLTPIPIVINSFLSRKRVFYIFVPDFQEDLSDNWAFYYLSEIVDEKKYWKLDARMDRFMQVFMDSAEVFLMERFHIFFTGLFGDLDRKHMDTINNTKDSGIKGVVKCISEIYKNIKVISNKKKLYNELCKILLKSIEYTPNEDDVFDRKFDDILLQKEYSDIDSEQISAAEKTKINRIFYSEKKD